MASQSGLVVCGIRAVFALCLCGWVGSASWGQEAAAIHSNVNLVNVSFTARDQRGALLDSLTVDQVSLFEDGVEQKIAHFAKSTDVPLTLALIVDASSSQEHFSKEHEKDIEIFLRNVLGPKDRAFLLCFGNHLRLVSDFTQSGSEMMERLKQYERKSDKFPQIGPKERRDLGTAFYDSIFYAVDETLIDAGGRRAIL